MLPSVGTRTMNHLITEASDDPLTLFRIWNGGMINQLMSIEIAAGMCSHFQRIGMLYESCKLTTEANFTKNKRKISIKEIINVPEFLCFITPEERDGFEAINIASPATYYVGSADKEFSEGRSQLFLNRSQNFHFESNLANYSIVFRDRTKILDTALSQVVFKSEYLQFAEAISSHLGDFNGIHIRLTDFSQQILSLSENDINKAFERISNIPVVIATDEPLSPKIKTHVDREISIESLILDEFAKDFESLTIPNEVTLGLVSLLVLTHSRQFIGTPKSTYSNYVHRCINQRKNGGHDWLSIGKQDPVFSGVYSWNSFPNMPIGQKLWEMEWPESLLRL